MIAKHQEQIWDPCSCRSPTLLRGDVRWRRHRRQSKFGDSLSTLSTLTSSGRVPETLLESELLRQHPFALVPDRLSRSFGASDAQRIDETVTEEVDAAGETGGVDDEVPPETPAARRAALPSSIGLSVMLPSACGSH